MKRFGAAIGIQRSMQQTAKIGLDMHVIDGLHQGSRVHCLELFSRVVALLPECTFFCLLARPSYLTEHWPAFNLPNVRLVEMPHRPAPQRLLLQLPALARQYGLDLLHTQYIVPPGLPCAAAVTVHDILFEGYPEYFPWMFRLRSRLLVRHSVRIARLVCTVSEYSRGAIASAYGIPAERILLVPNGASLERFHPAEDAAVDAAELEGLGLVPRDYLLTVGRLEPRKNHLRLLRAFAQLPAPRPRLVIVGERDFGYEGLFAELDRLRLQEDILLLEKVDDRLLPLLYRNARLFVYPSLAEGFGMPLLEAMASGIPVVTSNTTSLPEVAGAAAYLCDPASVASIAETIAAALADVNGRNDRVAAGIARARSFDWDGPAASLAAAYRQTLGLR